MARPLRRAEDILPKVLVAGKPNDCVPRIIICDGMQKKPKRTNFVNGAMQFRIPAPLCAASSSYHPPRSCSPKPSCTPEPSCPKPTSPVCRLPSPICRLPSPPTCCPPKFLPPTKASSRKKECCTPQQLPVRSSNLDDGSACSKLMCRMQNLKDEMYVMARQNEKMQQQLSGSHAVQRCRVNQSAPCARPVTFPKDVECRFRDYSKHNCLLEKQVEAMEQSVRRLNQQFIEAEKKQKEMELARMHALKMTQTLMCQQLERQPKLKCSGHCRGKCAQQTEKCSCSRPDYKCA